MNKLSLPFSTTAKKWKEDLSDSIFLLPNRLEEAVEVEAEEAEEVDSEEETVEEASEVDEADTTRGTTDEKGTG